jgi:hypothetical protein
MGYDGEYVHTSSILYLDVETGVTNVILTGEFETMESVSPDGRYIVVSEGRNGWIDASGIADEFTALDEHRNTLRLRLYDTHQGSFIYKFNERYLSSDVSMAIENQSDKFFWVDNTTLVMTYLPTAKIIKFREGGIHKILNVDGIEHFFLYDSSDSLYRRYLILADSATGLRVFDIVTEHYYSLFQNPQHQCSDYQWLAVDTLALEHCKIVSRAEDPYITYTVRLPALAGEN